MIPGGTRVVFSRTWRLTFGAAVLASVVVVWLGAGGDSTPRHRPGAAAPKVQGLCGEHSVEVRELCREFFSAADQHDLQAFRGTLTATSVALVETHIDLVNARPRPVGLSAYSWTDFVGLHAAIPDSRRGRVGYPFDQGSGRFDITGNAEAIFFETIATIP